MTREEFNAGADAFFDETVKLFTIYTEKGINMEIDIDFFSVHAITFSHGIQKAAHLLRWVERKGFDPMQVLAYCKNMLGIVKANEYGTHEDRLKQFKVSAKIMKNLMTLTPGLETYQTALGMSVKHFGWVALANDGEYELTQHNIEEHVGDSINYYYINTRNLQDIINE